MTRLCVPIFVHSLEQAKRDVARAIESGADLVELRLDHLSDDDASVALVRSIISGVDLPFVLTCRPEWEGGDSSLDDHDRTHLLLHVQSGVKGFTDTEWRMVKRSTGGPTGGTAIVSRHDFQSRPADLTKTFLEMQQDPRVDVAKLAWQARSIRDNVEAFELMRAGPKPTIAICMGESGAISRILAGKFGAFLTFASLDDTSATAPGQVRIDELKNTYRWDQITRATKVYGVVGAPVGHSMSPAIHNAGFDAIGFDGVYVPLLVQPGYESFKAFAETLIAFAPLDLGGLSITIPHKENALRYAAEKGYEIDGLAARIGAVNTFVLGDKPRAFSTDYAAILDTITAALGITRDGLNGLRVAVVGAGGTGRTAVAALRHLGASVTIFNRAADRAIELGLEFGAIAKSIESLSKHEADVFVNATSVGMSPDVDASIFDAGAPAMTGSTLVFDTVYNPIETKLLRVARDAGARTAGGIEMFVRQAVGQFEAWTGVAAPAEAMRAVVERRLRGE